MWVISALYSSVGTGHRTGHSLLSFQGTSSSSTGKGTEEGWVRPPWGAVSRGSLAELVVRNRAKVGDSPKDTADPGEATGLPSCLVAVQKSCRLSKWQSSWMHWCLKSISWWTNIAVILFRRNPSSLIKTFSCSLKVLRLDIIRSSTTSAWGFSAPRSSCSFWCSQGSRDWSKAG